MFVTEGEEARTPFLSLAYLQRSKHLWCLISKHKATFVCLLALLPLFATQGKQALARDRSQFCPFGANKQEGAKGLAKKVALSTKGA
jgi:hypothetical protein